MSRISGQAGQTAGELGGAAILAPEMGAPTASIWAIIRFVWRDLRLLILLGAVSIGLALCTHYIFDYPLPFAKILTGRTRKIIKFALLLGPLVLVGVVARRRWALPRVEGPSILERANWRKMFGNLGQNPLVAQVALAAATTVLMAGLFGVSAMWKSSIPVLNPWHWDLALLAVERTVHGGVLPQDVTRQLLGPSATQVLDRLYLIWFTVLILFIVWQSFRPPSPSRTRTLLAVVLTYMLLGNIAAVLLSSGGPVYFDRLVGLPNPYAEHTAYLAGMPGLRAPQIQISIWRWLQTHTFVPFGSISAMPSVHVAATVIMALASWERSRWLGMVGWLYVLVILVGSVHLNWHYAIDGYVAILGTLAIWWLSAWVVRRYA